MPLEGGSFEGFAETGSEPNAKRARFAKSEGRYSIPYVIYKIKDLGFKV